MLTASFDLKWPPMVEDIFSVATPVAEATTQFISIDCFIDKREDNYDVSNVRVFFIRLIVLGALPPIIVIIAWISWKFIAKFKKNNG